MVYFAVTDQMEQRHDSITEEQEVNDSLCLLLST